MNDDEVSQWYYHDSDDRQDAVSEKISPAGKRKKSKTRQRTTADTFPPDMPPRGISNACLWKAQGLDPETFECRILGYDKATALQAADFFLFMFERQSIWKRRQEGQAAPWSTIPFFQNYSFCNVYRELDRGTAFFHAHVVEFWQTWPTSKGNNNQREWTRHVLWWAYFYRMVNRLATVQMTGFPALDAAQTNAFIRNCRLVQGQRQAQGQKFFTGVHQPSNMQELVSGLQDVSRNDFALLTTVVDQMLAARTLRQCVQCLQRLPGIGGFKSWQLVCDLRESRCLLHVEEDDYCALGPGAKGKMSPFFFRLE